MKRIAIIGLMALLAFTLPAFSAEQIRQNPTLPITEVKGAAEIFVKLVRRDHKLYPRRIQGYWVYLQNIRKCKVNSWQSSPPFSRFGGAIDCNTGEARRLIYNITDGSYVRLRKSIGKNKCDHLNITPTPANTKGVHGDIITVTCENTRLTGTLTLE